MEMSEVEQEALESGEDVRSFQGQLPASPAGPDPHRARVLSAGNGREAQGCCPGHRRRRQQVSMEEVEELTDRFDLTIFSGEAEGVFLYNASDTMSYSGMPNIIIPLLISILIVLNTMISSVYERKREIAVYTSVGLAPTHVSFLFIAEALAFAVLSVRPRICSGPDQRRAACGNQAVERHHRQLLIHCRGCGNDAGHGRCPPVGDLSVKGCIKYRHPGCQPLLDHAPVPRTIPWTSPCPFSCATTKMPRSPDFCTAISRGTRMYRTACFPPVRSRWSKWTSEPEMNTAHGDPVRPPAGQGLAGSV